MMMRKSLLSSLLLALLFVGTTSRADTNWVEGKNYFKIQPAQPTSTPGKIEVMEVFSYGCPACNHFYPTAEKIRAALPPNAVMVYLPAAFNTAEDWPMFQRAYLTALAMGISEKTHGAMFDAIWKNGELAITDPQTDRLKNPLPSIEDAAKFYARKTGIKANDFVATSKSFSIDAQMRRADQLIKTYKVPSTPTMIINGKYRLDTTSAGGLDQIVELVKYLVAKEGK
jgi:thiol:disulfide interchange protein DsbA